MVKDKKNRTDEKSSLWERKKTTIIIVIMVSFAFLLYKKKINK